MPTPWNVVNAFKQQISGHRADSRAKASESSASAFAQNQQQLGLSSQRFGTITQENKEPHIVLHQPHIRLIWGR
jgi:hypothetical protein